MSRLKGLVALIGVAGFLFVLPTSAPATDVGIDEIIFQGGAGVNGSVLSGSLDASVSGGILTLVVTNTSTQATGGTAATNLLTDIGFTLPNGVTIANNAGINAVALGGSSQLQGTALDDTRWGADNNPASDNNITVGGDVTNVVSTITCCVEFNFTGATSGLGGPIDGPDYGILGKAPLGVGNCRGLPCIQNSLTFTLALAGQGLLTNQQVLDAIVGGYTVLSFGSPDSSTIPEPATLLLAGTFLAGIGASARRRFFRAKETLAAS